MSHAPDCALVQFGHLDPDTLKQPLICDCDQDDGPDDYVGDEAAEQARAASSHQVHAGPRVVITGAAAAAYQRFQAAARQLKAAHDAHAKALAAFTEAVAG